MKEKAVKAVKADKEVTEEVVFTKKDYELIYQILSTTNITVTLGNIDSLKEVGAVSDKIVRTLKAM